MIDTLAARSRGVEKAVRKAVLKSMTGFGRGSGGNADYRIGVEIRSVNHRYGEVSVRLPSFLNEAEIEISKMVAGVLPRGKIDVAVTFEDHRLNSRKIRVDQGLAAAYYDALQEISRLLDIPAPQSAELIARYPDVLIAAEGELDAKLFMAGLKDALRQALEQILQMRAAEGGHLKNDLLARLDVLECLTNVIEERTPAVVAAYRERLRDKLAAYASAAEIDASRLAQEVLLFADKVDSTEELVRLKSHFHQFRAALSAAAPVGRKLDFIVQEMNREANTIAAKGSDAEIAAKAVEMKSEIEKIREQVQNIE